MTSPQRLLSTALALLALWLAPPGDLALAQAPSGSAAARRADVAEAIDAHLAQHHALDQLSGAVLVADDGEVVYRGAFGEANSDWRIPNAPDTRFRLASVTKQFTAMAILLHVEDGALDLDAPITRYLGDYPAESGDRVTIRHLLNHTSGIPSYTDRPGFMTGEAKEQLGTREFVSTYCSDPLEFEPGTRFSYNNSAYFILGAILEEVSGKTYAEVLAERIFAPLGMGDSCVDDESRVLARRAVGYDDILGGRTVANWIDMSTPGAAGAMVSTVEDLWRWDQALRSERLLDGDLARLMFEPGLEDYAFGWEISELPGEGEAPSRKVQSHAGGMPGVSTLIWRVPAEGRCIIVLGNSFQTAGRSIRRGISALLDGQDPGDVRARGDLEIARTALEEGQERALEDLAKWPENVREDHIKRDVIGISHRLLEQGRAGDALSLGRFLVAAYEDDPHVLDALGHVERRTGDLEGALECYRRVLELDPDADAIRAIVRELEAELAED